VARLALLFLASGCGPAGYLAIVTRDANHAVQEAKAAGAPRLSPYEWTSAILYLERSHELAGYARWQDSLALGRRELDAAHREHEVIATRDYYSVGGGFVVTETESSTPGSAARSLRDSVVLPAPEGEDSTSMSPRRAIASACW